MKTNGSKLTRTVLLSMILPSTSFLNKGSILCSQASREMMESHMIKRNKQADLLKKYNEVKDPSSSSAKEGPEEARAADKEHRLFEKLLNSESATLNHMDEYGEGEYLTKQQEEEELDAMAQGVSRLFEGDEISSKVFEDLVSVQTEKALSESDVIKILPWLKNSESDEYVLIFCDPRPKNNEFRKIISSFHASYPKSMMPKVWFINADSPSENRRMVRKMQGGILAHNILSDEKRLWMRSVSALGEKRWSTTMFVLAQGRVQSLVRDFDFEMLQTIVNNALKRYRDYVS